MNEQNEKSQTHPSLVTYTYNISRWNSKRLQKQNISFNFCSTLTFCYTFAVRLREEDDQSISEKKGKLFAYQ